MCASPLPFLRERSGDRSESDMHIEVRDVVPTTRGFGFSVLTDPSATAFTVEFLDQRSAAVARELMVDIMAEAVALTPHGR